MHRVQRLDGGGADGWGGGEAGAVSDLVVTVPKSFGLAEWINEGDLPGEPWSGDYWSFYVGGAMPRLRLTGEEWSADSKRPTAPDRIGEPGGNSPGTELVYRNMDPDRSWLFCEPDQRCYIVAHERLRGYAPLFAVEVDERRHLRAFIRRGDAVAVTIPEVIRGFRGWRYRWWDRRLERPFPEWRDPRAVPPLAARDDGAATATGESS